MPKNRFKYIPEFLWPYLGDAFKGINEDLTALESSGVGGGGVTSWTQLNDKPTLSTVATSGAYADLTGRPSIPDVSGLAPKANPTFTGTVTGVTKAMVGLANVDNVADAMKAFAGTQITTGQIHPARLGTGTRDGSRFLADDGTWKALPTGNNSGVITTGPYTLDPKRAPAGSIVAIPETDVVLTHLGTRFRNTTAGVTVGGANQPPIGTYKLYLDAGQAVYDDTGLFGESMKITTTATATNNAQVSTSIPGGVREIQVSALLRLSAAPTADGSLLFLRRDAGAYAGVGYNAGSSAGNLRLIVLYDGWAYTSPDVAATATIRIAIAAKAVNGANTSSLRVAFYQVNKTDGTETQIGTTFETNTVLHDMTGQNFTDVLVGKLAGQAGYEGKSIWVDSIRVAYGVGAYGMGLLKAESLYPEPA